MFNQGFEQQQEVGVNLGLLVKSFAVCPIDHADQVRVVVASLNEKAAGGATLLVAQPQCTAQVALDCAS